MLVVHSTAQIRNAEAQSLTNNDADATKIENGNFVHYQCRRIMRTSANLLRNENILYS